MTTCKHCQYIQKPKYNILGAAFCGKCNALLQIKRRKKEDKPRKDLMYRVSILFATFAVLYGTIEVITRALLHQLPQYPYGALMGQTSLWMLLAGGIIGIFIALVLGRNKLPDDCIMIKIKGALGMLFIFTAELFSGLILNVLFQLHIWSYYNYPLNIAGQITLLYAPIWYTLTIFGLWVADYIRYEIFDEIKAIESPMDYFRKAFWR